MRMAAENAIVQRKNPKIATRILDSGTKIKIYFGNIVIPATLNDSDTAKALIKMLPYTISLSNYGNDFCGVMEQPLPYNEEDVHNGWLNGDIDFATDGNWFTILFGGEENSGGYGYQVNIGKIDCELEKISSLRGSQQVRIELAEVSEEAEG